VGVCAFLTLFTPLCAQMGPTALIILRVLEGFSSVNCLKKLKKKNFEFI
jgi:hypothetical protein